MARGRTKAWTPEQDAVLVTWWEKDDQKAVELLGRTWDACSNRWHRIERGEIVLNFRKCHEPGCNNLTTDYRCTKCQQKWKTRNEVCGACVDDGWV